MALSLRGSAEGSAVDGNDVTLTHPGGTAEDDVVYVAYGAGTFNTDNDLSVSTSGYTELADLFSNSSADGQLGVFRKVMGATPDSTVTCDGNGSSFSGTAAVEHVWTGADTTTPEDATTTTATGASTEPNSPSITTNTDDAVVLSAFGSGISDTAITDPSGYSNQVDRNANDFDDITVGLASKSVATAGAEDPGTWTDIGTGNTGWCAATVAIKPDAGGGHTGTGAPTLEAFTVAAVGAHEEIGTGAPTIETMAVSAVGVMQPEATGAPTLQALSVTAVGEQPATGQGAPTLQALALESVGVIQPEGTGAPSLAEITVTAAGIQRVSGQGAPEIAGLLAAGTGVELSAGTAAALFDALTVLATGTVAGGEIPEQEEEIATGGWPLSYKEWARRRYRKDDEEDEDEERDRPRRVAKARLPEAAEAVDQGLPPPPRSEAMEKAVEQARAALAPLSRRTRRRSQREDDEWFMLIM